MLPTSFFIILFILKLMQKRFIIKSKLALELFWEYILGKFNRSRRLSKKFILKRYNEPGIFEIFRGKDGIGFDVLGIVPDRNKWKTMSIIEAFRRKISFIIRKEDIYSNINSYIGNKNIFEISEYNIKNLFSIYNQVQRDYANIK